MKKQIFVFALSFSLLFVWAAVAFGGIIPHNPALKKKSEQLNSELVAAFNAGDMLKVASFFSDDATILLPGGKKLQGRKAITEYWAGLKGAQNMKMEVEDATGTSDMIYNMCKVSYSVVKDGQPTNQTSDVVMIWKKQADWSYKLYLNSANN